MAAARSDKAVSRCALVTGDHRLDCGFAGLAGDSASPASRSLSLARFSHWRLLLLKKLFFLFGFVVLSNSCLNQFFYEIKGQFFMQGETDRCFGGFVAFEFTFVLLYDGSWYI